MKVGFQPMSFAAEFYGNGVDAPGDSTLGNAAASYSSLPAVNGQRKDDDDGVRS
jgi:hypothetical protein